MQMCGKLIFMLCNVVRCNFIGVVKNAININSCQWVLIIDSHDHEIDEIGGIGSESYIITVYYQYHGLHDQFMCAGKPTSFVQSQFLSAFPYDAYPIDKGNPRYTRTYIRRKNHFAIVINVVLFQQQKICCIFRKNVRDTACPMLNLSLRFRLTSSQAAEPLPQCTPHSLACRIASSETSVVILWERLHGDAARCLRGAKAPVATAGLQFHALVSVLLVVFECLVDGVRGLAFALEIAGEVCLKLEGQGRSHSGERVQHTCPGHRL